MLNQLPLPFPFSPHYGALDFIAGESNEDALAWLAPGNVWPGGRLALWGESGVGKTHLLQVWAKREGASVVDAADRRDWPSGPLAVDAADRWADEEALLHLLNAAAEAGFPVLLAGREPPARWPVALPDLRSRLRAITAVELRPPEEALLDALLARLLAERQLAVTADMQGWIRMQLPRTPAALREAVGRIDGAALAARKLTWPVLRGVVTGMADADAAPCE
jgi:chromosomal replication initiation ATPase DnaA